MKTINITVNKHWDGYSFSLLPRMLERLKEAIPSAHPIKGIFMAHDVKESFEAYIERKLDVHLYAILFGISDNEPLKELDAKGYEVRFVDAQTGKLLIPKA